jgi:hypothetical protein
MPSYGKGDKKSNRGIYVNCLGRIFFSGSLDGEKSIKTEHTLSPLIQDRLNTFRSFITISR